MSDLTFSRRRLHAITLLLVASLCAWPAFAAVPPAASPPMLDPGTNRVDLTFPEPVSAHIVYQALGDAFGITVVFDRDLRDRDLAVTLEQVDFRRAVTLLTQLTGHFATPLDSKTLLIAEDNPQKRRTYEPHVVQTFELHHAEVKDVMQSLRAMLSLKHVSAQESLNRIVVRDTAERTATIERLVRTLDQAPSAIEIDVEVLQLPRDRMATLARALGATTGTLPNRTDDAGLSRLRAQSAVLAAPTLATVDGHRTRFQLTDQLPLAPFSAAGDPLVQEIGLELDLRAHVHEADRLVSLEIHADLLGVTGRHPQDGTPIVGKRRLTTDTRLASGESYLLRGFLHTDGQHTGTGVLHLGSAFTDPAGTGHEVIVALTPRIVRASVLTPEQAAPHWVGTDSRIGHVAHLDTPTPDDAPATIAPDRAP